MFADLGASTVVDFKGSLFVESMARTMCLNFLAPITWIPVHGALPVCSALGTQFYYDPRTVTKSPASIHGSPAWSVRAVAPKAAAKASKSKKAGVVSDAVEAQVEETESQPVLGAIPAPIAPLEIKQAQNTTLEIKTREVVFTFNNANIPRSFLQPGTRKKEIVVQCKVYFLVPRPDHYGTMCELTRPFFANAVSRDKAEKAIKDSASQVTEAVATKKKTSVTGQSAVGKHLLR